MSVVWCATMSGCLVKLALWCPLLVTGFISYQCHAYKVRTPAISLLHPRGLRISYKDENGISLVAVHFSVNKPLPGVEAGQINYDMTLTTDGKWLYENRNIDVKAHDTVNYWLYVIWKGLGYHLLNRSWIARGSTSIATTMKPVSSSPKITTFRSITRTIPTADSVSIATTTVDPVTLTSTISASLRESTGPLTLDDEHGTTSPTVSIEPGSISPGISVQPQSISLRISDQPQSSSPGMSVQPVSISPRPARSASANTLVIVLGLLSAIIMIFVVSVISYGVRRKIRKNTEGDYTDTSQFMFFSNYVPTGNPDALELQQPERAGEGDPVYHEINDSEDIQQRSPAPLPPHVVYGYGSVETIPKTSMEQTGKGVT